MPKLLIVVDYQNDFVTGSLGFKKATEIENNIVEKIKKYKENNDEVVFTFDTHDEDYLKTQEGKNLPIKHCINHTDGYKLYGKVSSFCSDNTKQFKKPSFGSNELGEYLKTSDYESIELVGVVTNICVISNAIIAKTALPESLVMVDASCVASNDDSLHEKALDVMESLQIKIFNRD